MSEKRSWEFMRGNFPTLPEDPSYTDVLEAVRRSCDGQSLSTLAERLAKLQSEKDAAEEVVAGLNAVEKGIETVILGLMHDADLDSVTTKNGGKFKIDPQVDAKVAQEDRAKLAAWIEANNMKELLSVHAMTLSSLCRKRLEAGEALPDGVEMVPRNKLKYSVPKKAR